MEDSQRVEPSQNELEDELDMEKALEMEKAMKSQEEFKSPQIDEFVKTEEKPKLRDIDFILDIPLNLLLSLEEQRYLFKSSCNLLRVQLLPLTSLLENQWRFMLTVNLLEEVK